MPANRMDQVDEFVHRELAQMIIRELELPSSVIVTIAKVKTSKDLAWAKVFITVLPFDQARKIQAFLNKNSRQLQKVLNNKLSTHRTPKLKFLIDESVEKADRINQLLDNLK